MGFTDVLRKAFPFISVAASLGGPLGTMAANAVGSALGAPKVDPGNLQDVLSKAMANPDQLLALKKAENDFQQTMTGLGYQHIEELEAIAEKDRESARGRETTVHDLTPRILAYGITMGFFGVLAMMLIRPIPDAGHDVFLVLVGSLGAAWTGIVAYYFGSSSGSAAKTDILAAQARK